MKFAHPTCSLLVSFVVSLVVSFAGVAALFFGPLAPTAQAQCPADQNADHLVTAQDLSFLLAAWGPAPTPVAPDLNHDQSVDAQDLAILLAAWGPCPGPAWATILEWDPNPEVVTDAAFRARMIATGLPWRVLDNGTNIEMLLVPPGTFMMGASPGDAEANSNENPAHQVTLTNAFYLNRTEVTQAQWQAKMGSNPSYFQGHPNNPVEQISWNNCQSFCTLTGMRFPTEAEWEYACRGGNLEPRYGSPKDIAWYYENSGCTDMGCTSHEVEAKSPNALGFYDTLGNVWEWCQDWNGPYTAASATNPTGPTSGTARLLRGGSWGSSSSGCRASMRNSYPPSILIGNIGFRAARTP